MLTIETDVGHDPDDLFALRYLYLKGIKIEQIIISPGYDYQFALANECCPGVSLVSTNTVKKPEPKLSRLYSDLSKNRLTYQKYIVDICDISIDGCHLVIGPPKAVTQISKEKYRPSVVYFQGGFLQYSLYRPTVTLEKFEGQESVQSFNPGGCREGFDLINSHSSEKTWISKNICHTTELGNCKFKDPLLQKICSYLEPSKKLHDLLAAALYYNPFGATFILANMNRSGNKFYATPNPQGNNRILADLDYDKFYREIQTV